MLAGRRFLYRQFDPIPKVINSRLSASQHTDARAEHEDKRIPSSEQKVVIPPRVERGPTDILKALSSTVGYDPTANHYRFPDDPYFRLVTLRSQKLCGLALESGKKSAKWVIENNPALFQHKVSEPHIKAFCPKLPAKDETDFSEEHLMQAIDERDVDNAIKIYEALKSKSSDVSKSTKQHLLELVCFYNSSPVPEVDVEKSWWGFVFNSFKGKNTWKAEGFAEKLFQEMDSDCPLANSALIVGKHKHGDMDGAREHFEKARKANINLTVEAYNCYLYKFIQNSKQGDFHSFQKTLEDMAREGIKPNLETLNTLLSSLLRMKYQPRRKLWGDMVFEELVGLGIEPSLGTYGRLIAINLKAAKNLDLGHQSAMDDALNILDEIEKKYFEVRCREDFYFFREITMACEEFEDVDPRVLEKTINFYFTNGNSRFVKGARTQEDLFQIFCFILLRRNEIERAMEVFRRYVFKMFHPHPELLLEIIKCLEFNFAPQYLPDVWEAINNPGYYAKPLVLARFLNLVNTFTDEESLKVFHSAAISFMQKIDDQAHKLGKGLVFSDLLFVFAECKDAKNTKKLVQHLNKTSMGNFNPECLKVVMKFVMTLNDFPLTLDVLTLARETNRQLAAEIAKEIVPNFSGEEKQVIARFIAEERRGKKGEKTIEEIEI